MDSVPILVRVYKMINLYNSVQKKPHTYSNALVLYPAQTHMLEMIGEHPGITQSEIAAEYMLTKGAVSQTVSFLEGKSLTVREPSPKGGRNQGLYLSERGQRVLAEHHALHGNMIAEISRLAGQLPPEAIDILSQITDVIEENIRNMQQQ